MSFKNNIDNAHDDGYDGESDTPKEENVNSIQNFLDLFDPIFEFIEETTDKNKLYLNHVNRNYIENIQMNLFKAYTFLYYAYFMFYGFWGSVLNAICPCWCVNSTHRSLKEVQDIFLEEEFTKIAEYDQLRIEAKIEKELRRYSDNYDDDDFEEDESELVSEEEHEEEVSEEAHEESGEEASEETGEETGEEESEADNEKEHSEEDQNEEECHSEQENNNEEKEKNTTTGVMTRLRKRNLNKN